MRFRSSTSFLTPGGINKPKIVVANDSNGAKHKQLVKSGNDDLRQVRCGAVWCGQ
jgi:hypothetical protein